MKKAGRFFLTLSFALLAAWIIPWALRLVSLKPHSMPFTLWSAVVDDFVSLDNKGNDWRFTDTKGNEWVGDTSDFVLPLYYSSDVISRGDMPDSLGGKKITADEIERNRVIMTNEPSNLEKVTPRVYLLMESEPRRSSLQGAEMAMVSRKDGLHIFRMEGNAEDKALSAEFNKALDGFVHPVAMASGNPSDRKSYDEGWLFVDSAGALWHVKLQGGHPFAEKFSFPGALPIQGIMITEQENRATLGYITDAKGTLWMLRPGGEFVSTAVKYTPSEDEIMVIGDMLNYTVSINGDGGVTYYALDADDFSLVDTLHREFPESRPPVVASALLPARLWFVSGDDGYVRPRVSDFSWPALILNVLLACAWGIFAKRRKYRWLDFPAIVVGGIFTAIPLWLLRE